MVVVQCDALTGAAWPQSLHFLHQQSQMGKRLQGMRSSRHVSQECQRILWRTFLPRAACECSSVQLTARLPFPLHYERIFLGRKNIQVLVKRCHNRTFSLL